MNNRYATPEEMGVSSRDIEEYLDLLEEKRLATHDVIIARGGKILFEKYWHPFHREEKHRMYSVTKSFVSLAIGFLEQEGKISLDDPLSLYFPEESKDSHPFQKEQTIRHSLMMATAMPNRSHFRDKPEDRVAYYFDNHKEGAHPSGTVFRYDSAATFVLGALVERVTGKKLFVYLKEKLFDKIGVGEVDCLDCVGGHSWSDSALLCRPIDLLRVAEFCMHGGEGILNENYLRLATSKQIDNAVEGRNEYNHQGYGYLFWRCFDNSFYFSGMGCQLALCIPDKDMVLVYNGDNQGFAEAKAIILEGFLRLVARKAKDAPLPPDEPVGEREYTLLAAKGEGSSPLAESISGKIYHLEPNPMGIRTLSLKFTPEGGIFSYENERGNMEIPFGLCRNEISLFPEKGYSDRVATEKGDRLYRCAASGAWVDKNAFFLKVQIIDSYFGNFSVRFGFDGGKVGLCMKKSAEDFLHQYDGFAGGKYE